VFEIAKTPTGYASTPTILVSLNQSIGLFPGAGLVADANGDLFGTNADGGAFGFGTVFEIEKTATGYASTQTTLVNFNFTSTGPEGAHPIGSLIAYANGDLFGTALAGGAFGDGAVFEIVKTASGYASVPTTLASFEPVGLEGADPARGVIADSNGDLFGTTQSGGAAESDIGTVFEIVKTAAGYASTPTTLANLNGYDDFLPQTGVIADARGDLFGTTGGESVGNDGTVFEIKKTAAGYANAPITLFSFNETSDNLLPSGGFPQAGLLADANGDLFGTTSAGGPNGGGTVFEITDRGFATTGSVTPPLPPLTGSHDILFQNASGQVAGWEVSGAILTASELLGANPGPNWKVVGAGDFDHDEQPDILLRNPNGNVAIWETDGTDITGAAAVANPGSNWRAVGSGDFDGDLHSDILLQNASGQVAIWEMNGTSIARSAVVANPGPNWKAVATGDFNHDGHSDILLQKHERPSGDLGDGRDQRDQRDAQRRRGQSRGELESDRNRRLQRRRPFRRSAAEHERQCRDLGDGRDQRDQRDAQRRRGQSRGELARDRNGRRRLRHPASEHERPDRDLGYQRNRSRRRQRQRRAELAGYRAELTRGPA
jgi:uncharacterized repeat protein (TIGR03803 family)